MSLTSPLLWPLYHYLAFQLSNILNINGLLPVICLRECLWMYAMSLLISVVCSKGQQVT